MKYIRTKDGRIIDDYYYHQNDKEYHWFTEEDILKQADTIEELCDVIVYDHEFYHFSRISKKVLVIDTFEEEFEFEITPTQIKEGIYGAFWTDKGLIYKAKMKGVSSKGEIDWELL